MAVQEKHKIKRTIAIISFVAMLAVIAATLIIVVVGNDNTAANLSAASPILATLLLSLSGIIGGYFGIAHHDDMRSGE